MLFHSFFLTLTILYKVHLIFFSGLQESLSDFAFFQDNFFLLDQLWIAKYIIMYLVTLQTIFSSLLFFSYFLSPTPFYLYCLIFSLNISVLKIFVIDHTQLSYFFSSIFISWTIKQRSTMSILSNSEYSIFLFLQLIMLHFCFYHSLYCQNFCHCVSIVNFINLIS